MTKDELIQKLKFYLRWTSDFVRDAREHLPDNDEGDFQDRVYEQELRKINELLRTEPTT